MKGNDISPYIAGLLDPVFPEAGGLIHLKEVRGNLFGKVPIPEQIERMGGTFLHPIEADHVRKMLVLLGDDEEAKSTLMCMVAYIQNVKEVDGYRQDFGYGPCVKAGAMSLTSSQTPSQFMRDSGARDASIKSFTY